MPYTNCSVCGAKALVGATRCPRCQAPFVSYDLKGERVETVNCPNCGVQRPAAIGVCPNCLTSTTPSGRRLTRGLILASVAVAALMIVGYAISRRAELVRPTPPSVAPQPADTAAAVAGLSSDSSAQAPDTSVHDIVRSPATSTGAPVTPVAAPITTPAPPNPALPPRVAVPDTGRWEFAVATTWVRVRSAPTRESDVLRMVDSAQRVRLGPPSSGWRPIRVGVDRGWVDPRFFRVIAAPAPRP